MSYGPRQRCPESRAPEPGSHSAARVSTPARSRRATRQELLHLQAACLPLPRPGAATQTPCSGRRCEGTRSIEPQLEPRRAVYITTAVFGSDAYRHLKGAVCSNPPVRQDQLDAVVWEELMRLLGDPSIMQNELTRRLQAARNADPLKQRQDQLHRDRARLAKGMDRLLIAYQEGLASLEQLRQPHAGSP